MVISTPGGTVKGVRPSFEGRFDVAEKCRRLVGPCQAGMRNPGRAEAAGEAPKTAWPRTLP
jgi:hypothetical protein